MPQGDWHHPRKPLACDTFVAQTRSLIPERSQFGGRRTGNADFLPQDLDAHAARRHDPFGLTPPIPQARQSRVRTRTRYGLCDQWHKDWRLNDPLCDTCVLDRPDTKT
jgi:hypothetical protein